MLKNYDIDYFFDRGKRETPKFWQRNGGKPILTGKVCCDIGCGHGSLCIDMALSGAEKVIGYDTDCYRIAFAKEVLASHFPKLVNKVEFYDLNFYETPTIEQFDIITSKDAFEHIIDLPQMLESIKQRLRLDGFLYVGFGPLYNDFYGDHRRTKRIVPWGHVLFPPLNKSFGI
jgi:2-polyprenyl-3-methyl-5-hydroxy-6-metoxy-1,4-benzoquinol methylase